MKHMACVVFIALLARPVPASAQSVKSEDPLLGTWQLNVAQSTYKPGPAPRAQTRIYKKHRFGIEATVKTIQADGRSTTVQSVYDYDQQEHPVTGSEDVDAIVVTRTSAQAYGATFSHAGQSMGTLERIISSDGRRMTVTTRRRVPEITNVEVYEKDEP